jgi:serine/threonine protein kinase
LLFYSINFLGNILLKKEIIGKNIYWTPKVTDFGMARKFRTDKSHTMSANVGTAIYHPPELWTSIYGKAEQTYKYEVCLYFY